MRAIVIFSLFCISVIGFYVIAAGINQSLDFLQKFCYNIYVRNKEKAKAYKKIKVVFRIVGTSRL